MSSLRRAALFAFLILAVGFVYSLFVGYDYILDMTNTWPRDAKRSALQTHYAGAAAGVPMVAALCAYAWRSDPETRHVLAFMGCILLFIVVLLNGLVAWAMSILHHPHAWPS